MESRGCEATRIWEGSILGTNRDSLGGERGLCVPMRALKKELGLFGWGGSMEVDVRIGGCCGGCLSENGGQKP